MSSHSIDFQHTAPVLPIKDGIEDGNHEEPRQLSLKTAPRVSDPDIVTHPQHDADEKS